MRARICRLLSSLPATATQLLRHAMPVEEKQPNGGRRGCSAFHIRYKGDRVLMPGFPSSPNSRSNYRSHPLWLGWRLFSGALSGVLVPNLSMTFTTALAGPPRQGLDIVR